MIRYPMNRMFKNMVYNDTQNMFFDDRKIEKFSLLTLTVALATYVVLQLYYCTVALATYVIFFFIGILFQTTPGLVRDANRIRSS